MHTHTRIFPLLALLSGCYHGLDLDEASGFSGGPAGPDEPTGANGSSTGAAEDTNDDAASDDGDDDDDDSSGGSDDGGEPVDGLQLGDECLACGCVASHARAASPSLGDDLRVDLAAMPDGGTLLAAAGSDAVNLTRFDEYGAQTWSRNLSGTVEDVQVIAVGLGFYVLAGSFRGALELAPNNPTAKLTSAGGLDAFVSFHSENDAGAPIWHRTFGDSEDQRITDLARTGDCHGKKLDDCRLHLAGIAVGMLGLLDDPPNSESTDYFLLGLPADTANGAAWSLRVTSGVVSPPPPSLAVTAADDLVLATTLVEDDDPGDIVIQQMNRDGTAQWTHRIVAAGEQFVGQIAAAHDGSLRLSGRTRSQIGLAGVALGTDGVMTPFLAGLDGVGEPTWAHAIAGWPPEAAGLAVSGNRTMLTGYVNDEADFGGGVLPFGGGRDVFIARYDPSGAHRCSGLYGGLDSQSGLLAISDGEHRVHLVARVRGSIAFASGEWLASETAEDLMVATYEF